MLRIKELRAEKQLSQRELAAGISSTNKNIWAYENGIAVPPLDVLERMADFFSCSIDYLVGRSDDFGNVTVYKDDSLSIDEQKIIDALRKNAPIYPGEFVTMYAELPTYMQETIFAELKGMHLGYKVAKKKTN